jgi:hypothetical protein
LFSHLAKVNTNRIPAFDRNHNLSNFTKKIRPMSASSTIRKQRLRLDVKMTRKQKQALLSVLKALDIEIKPRESLFSLKVSSHTK